MTLYIFSYLEPDSVLQHHKALQRDHVALCETAVGVGDGELHGHRAEGTVLGVTNHKQGGHAVAQAREGRGLPQQEVLAGVKGNDSMSVVTGQNVHCRFKKTR